MKTMQFRCDRCKTPLTPDNWLLDEELCNKCQVSIQLAQQVAKDAAIANTTIGETAKEIVDLYQP